MGVKTIGISLQPGVARELDRLARREGVSRSGMVANLVERASQKNGVPVVSIDGVRFVPELKR